MRITGIRDKDGSKPELTLLDNVCEVLIGRAAKKGFLTGAERGKGFSIHVGQNSRCFSVDVERLGHNARVGTYVSSPKGYKRTNVPTWEQRENFNHIINDVLDMYGLKANIKSGPYVVRNKDTGRVDEWTPLRWDGSEDPYGIGGASYNGMGQLMSKIITEQNAREECDSDRLEAEHKAKQHPIKLEQARQARERRKAVMVSPWVKVVISRTWYVRKELHKFDDKVLSNKQFKNLLNKLDSKEKRYFKFEVVTK